MIHDRQTDENLGFLISAEAQLYSCKAFDYSPFPQWENCVDILASQMHRTFTNYFLCNVSGCLDIKQDNKQAASDAAVCQLVFRFQVAPPVKHAGRHPPSSVTLRHACLPHPHFQDEMPLAHTAWRDIHPAERERERVQTVELEQKRKRETDRLVTKWRNRSDPPFSA